MKLHKGDGELAFTDHATAYTVAQHLITEDYIVMISVEENLIILNYLWEFNADRNHTVFMRREDFDEEFISREVHNDIKQHERDIYDALEEEFETLQKLFDNKIAETIRQQNCKEGTR